MQGGSDGSLFDTLDHTVTSAGARLLRQWIQRPRRDRGELTRRQQSVAALTEAAMAREELRETLDPVYDLERLASKAVSGSADARDLRSVGETLALLDAVADLVDRTGRLAESPLVDVPPVSTARPSLPWRPRSTTPPSRSHRAPSPRAASSGRATTTTWTSRGEPRGSPEWIETLPEREKEKTGITHLSVDRNKTDGYYIQVGKSETDQVPAEYDAIKTLKNSERYTIPELQEREREVLRLEERRHDMEYGSRSRSFGNGWPPAPNCSRMSAGRWPNSTRWRAWRPTRSATTGRGPTSPTDASSTSRAAATPSSNRPRSSSRTTSASTKSASS